MGIFEDFITESLAGLIRGGGKLTTDEHAQARLNICAACEHRGKVRPIYLIEVEGCTLCGCPLATKARTLTKAGVLGFGRVECPAGKWKEIDQKHLENGI